MGCIICHSGISYSIIINHFLYDYISFINKMVKKKTTRKKMKKKQQIQFELIDIYLSNIVSDVESIKKLVEERIINK